MSGFRDTRREPQDCAHPAVWQSCLGRLPKPPENAKIAFRWGWHKLEMPQPLRRPAQTRQAPPAPASSIETRRCSVVTTPPEGRSERHTTAPRSVQRLPGLAQNGYQDSAYLAVRPVTARAPQAPNTAVRDSVATSKMPKSRSWGVGMHLRRPGHSRAPPRLAQAPRLAHGPIAGHGVSGLGVVSSDLHGGRSRCARRPPPWHLGDPVGCAGQLRRVPGGLEHENPISEAATGSPPAVSGACGARALPGRTTDVAQDPYPF